MPRKRTGIAILPDRSVQRHSVMSLDTACSLANGPSWGGGGCLRENYVFCVPRELQRLLSLLSMGGVCGRSLTVGKILFTGRQTCSLYLVDIMTL